jgi:hypothetical protein
MPSPPQLPEEEKEEEEEDEDEDNEDEQEQDTQVDTVISTDTDYDTDKDNDKDMEAEQEQEHDAHVDCVISTKLGNQSVRVGIVTVEPKRRKLYVVRYHYKKLLPPVIPPKTAPIPGLRFACPPHMRGAEPRPRKR